MSRSVKHSPWMSHCGGDSDRWWKRHWHQKMRAASRTVLHSGFDSDSQFLPHHCEVSDVYDSRRDWWMRFDPAEHPERMRK